MGPRIALWITSFLLLLTWPVLGIAGSARNVALNTAPRTLAQSGRQLRPAPPARRVAARQPAQADIRTTGRTPRAPKSWDLRINIAGGYGQVDSNVSTEQQLRDGGGFHQGTYFGLGTDLTLYRYFGAEIEGYYGGIGSASNVTAVDPSGTTVSETKRKLRQYGVMGDAQGRLPLYWGRIKIIPRAGLGYGWLNTESIANDVSATKRLTGLYATGGAEIWITRDLSVSGDYAVSLGANSDDAGNSTDGRFDRVRAGAAYRVAEPVLLGAQYLRRQLRSSQASGPDLTETSNQVLGTIQLGF